VRKRDGVIRRLAEARERSASARARESVIRRAGFHARSKTHPRMTSWPRSEHALDHPVFSLDSCGVVFISWMYQP